MGISVGGQNGIIDEFASNLAYSNLIEASQKTPVLKEFFDNANTEDVSDIVKALRSLKSNDNVEGTAKRLADLIDGQDLAFITDGVETDDSVNKRETLVDVKWKATISKVESARQMVFGWASIVMINGKILTDTQGDMITAATIEDAAYNYVLYARKGGEMHSKGLDGSARGVSRMIESCVFTSEKQTAMLSSLHDQGITGAVLNLNCEAWWIGFKIDDPGVWQDVVQGKYKAFSIGGKGKRDANPSF